MNRKRMQFSFLVSVPLCLAAAGVLLGHEPTPSTVTAPKEHFGFNIGDDYCLANYKQLESYWKKIEKQTDRLKVVSIGKTEEGRDQLMAIVTSPANHARLATYRDIAKRMARAEGLTEADARKLAVDGKAVVWIDGGLHASELLCAQVLIESMYQWVTATDPESLRILDDVIILFVHCNPDGMDLCADWYMRAADPKKRTSQGLPRLYEKYAGHDNNRDFYAANLAETRNMNRVMYREWFPQIVFNHHQTGPAGTVMFIPPCRDPFNYNIHPLVISGIEAVGTAMVQRFIAEDMPGVTMRSGARYSTWFNGGLSTTCQFHNMIGLFSETIGGPTPSNVPLLANKLLPNSDYLSPITPRPWKFRQSVDYSVMANKALLDYASRNREHLLYNIYRMGKNSIDAGNRDNWSITPKVVAAARGNRGPNPGGDSGPQGPGGFRGQGRGGVDFTKAFRDPAKRDPRAFIIPSDQPDFLTATKFVNKLIGSGIQVHRATADFEAGGSRFPAGSYVVQSGQAFRAHVFDMFEPQDHPDDFAVGATVPTAPYDMAGWTLAYQMGVKFARILEGVSGPFEELTDEAPPPSRKVATVPGAAGYFLDTRINDAFRVANRLLASGEDVHRLQKPFVADGVTYPAGTFFVVAKATTQPLVEKFASQLGTPFVSSTSAPGREAVPLKPVRVGLWDRYGGSMPSGWTRLILEQFEFPYSVVSASELDQGDLRNKFDVLVFVEGAIPSLGGGGRFGPGGGRGGAPGAGGAAPVRPPAGGGDQPPETGNPNAAQRVNVTTTKTVPVIKKFLEDGGTVFTVGSSTSLANHVGLPLKNHFLLKDANGEEKPIGRDKFYVPGSLLQIHLDPENSLTWGMEDKVDVMFSSSPTFRLPDGDEAKGLKRVGWFVGNAPLRSGWAWGQDFLNGGIAIAEAPVGKGRLVLCGPQVLFRGQPDGTFKLLFNTIVQAGLKDHDQPAKTDDKK